MTERTYYAIVYKAKEGSGKEDLWLSANGAYAASPDINNAKIYDSAWTARQGNFCDYFDSDHHPARVVKIRETVTREVIEE